jgi:hypothetical protein
VTKKRSIASSSKKGVPSETEDSNKASVAQKPEKTIAKVLMMAKKKKTLQPTPKNPSRSP